MGKLHKFRLGERIGKEFPAGTWNALVDEVKYLRNRLSEIIDQRTPKDKSSVVVRLVWAGASDLAHGSCVKLGTSVFDPAVDESAPLAGLTFHCDEFSALDSLNAYAIAQGPIKGGGDGVGYGVIPQAYWAKVLVSDAGHEYAKPITGGTILDSHESEGLRILWKQSGTGELWTILSLIPATTTTREPPLRAFELTANKTLASATATAKFLDLDGNMVGGDVTLHDPEHRFSGRIYADLYAGSPGFRGYALEHKDLAEEDSNRYEIITMDSLMEFVKGRIVKQTNYPDPGSTTIAQYIQEINQNEYDRHPPAAAEGEIGYLSDEDIFDDADIPEPENESEAPDTSKIVLMQLTDPDADPPEYRVYEVKGSSATTRSMAAVVRVASEIAAGTESGAGGPDTGQPFSVDPETGAYDEIDAEYLESLFGTGPFSESPKIWNPFGYSVNARESNDEFALFPAIIIGYFEETVEDVTMKRASYLLTGNALLSFTGAETAGNILHTPDGTSIEYDAEECEE